MSIKEEIVMSEKIKNEATELTDKEMNQVVGGIGDGCNCSSSISVRGVSVECDQVLSPSEFGSRYYEGEQNSCASHSPASSNSNLHCCETCMHFTARAGYIWKYTDSSNANGSGSNLPSGGRLTHIDLTNIASDPVITM